MNLTGKSIQRISKVVRSAERQVIPGYGRRARRIIRHGGGGNSSFFTAQVYELNADGEHIDCYLWDEQAEEFGEDIIEVLKPSIFRPSTWEGQTISYTDYTTRTYSRTGVPPLYGRKSTWVDRGVTYTELQLITSPYGIGEEIRIEKLSEDTYEDTNRAGRHWAKFYESEE